MNICMNIVNLHEEGAAITSFPYRKQILSLYESVGNVHNKTQNQFFVFCLFFVFVFCFLFFRGWQCSNSYLGGESPTRSVFCIGCWQSCSSTVRSPSCGKTYMHSAFGTVFPTFPISRFEELPSEFPSWTAAVERRHMAGLIYQLEEGRGTTDISSSAGGQTSSSKELASQSLPWWQNCVYTSLGNCLTMEVVETVPSHKLFQTCIKILKPLLGRLVALFLFLLMKSTNAFWNGPSRFFILTVGFYKVQKNGEMLLWLTTALITI